MWPARFHAAVGSYVVNPADFRITTLSSPEYTYALSRCFYSSKEELLQIHTGCSYSANEESLQIHTANVVYARRVFCSLKKLVILLRH